MNNKLRFRLLVVFFIIVLCFGFTIKNIENDTFYLIKLGDYIFNNGIDLKDHWCWITGLSYTYPHWLFDVFIYLIYNNFGYLGVYVSTAILFIILILIIYIINLRINKSEFMAFIVVIVSIFSLIVGVTARSQLISYIIFILEVYFIERLIFCGKKRYVIYLSLLSLLLANIHATIWLFYFVLFLPFIFEYLLYKVIDKFNLRVNDKFLIGEVNNFRLLIISFVTSFVMGIFSPSKICYTYIFRIMMGNSQSLIQEHLPLVVIDNPLFLGLILLIILILVFTDTKIKFKELFMISGLVFMSLCSNRHILLFYLIGVIYISVICIRFLNDKNDKSLDILSCLFVKNFFVYLFCFIIIFIIGYSRFNYNFSKDYVNNKYYPVEAVKYIKNNIDLDDFRVYNDYNYGSYMLFNDLPVFIDSRCDLYLKEFNKLDIFNDAYSVNSDYENIFEYYDVNYVLINNGAVLFRLLCKDSNYVIEYSDDYFTLFKLNV